MTSLKPAALGAIAAALLVVGLGLGWTLNGWRLASKVAACERDHAQEVARVTAENAQRMLLAAENLAAAAAEAQKRSEDAARVLRDHAAALRKAALARPLPDDCKRDSGRASSLQQGFQAAREAVQ